MKVDQKSIDLAKHFLSDVKDHTPEDVTELAEAIQQLCEDLCEAIERSRSKQRRPDV